MQRYNLVVVNEFGGVELAKPCSDPNGAWVRSDDALAVQAENQRLAAERDAALARAKELIAKNEEVKTRLLVEEGRIRALKVELAERDNDTAAHSGACFRVAGRHRPKGDTFPTTASWLESRLKRLEELEKASAAGTPALPLGIPERLVHAERRLAGLMDRVDELEEKVNRP